MDKEHIRKEIIKCKDNISLIRAGLESAVTTLITVESRLNTLNGLIDVGETVTKEELPMMTFHTDGACIVGQGIGGWAYWENYGTIKGSGSEVNATSNRMELLAVIKVLEMTPPNQPLTILSDSQLTVSCANDKFKIKANIDLWERYKVALKGRDVILRWEPRDSSSGNRAANKLAQDETKKLQRQLTGKDE